MHFPELKKAIEHTFGRPINNRPDCEALSVAIFEQTKRTISYNTLRRFFQLAGDKSTTKLSQNTLDVLANYCGYPTHSAFEMEQSAFTSISTFYRLQLHLQQKEHLTRTDVEQCLAQIPDEQQRYNFMNAVILLAFKRADLVFLKELFQLSAIFNGDHYLNSNLYFLIHTIGIQIRHQPELSHALWEAWAQDDKARFYYFELFVDMDFLFLSHYRALEYYDWYSTKKRDRLFASSLLAWRHLLMGDFTHASTYLERIQLEESDNRIHPLVIARVFNALLLNDWLTKKAVSPQRMSDLLRFKDHFQSEVTPFFELWICEGLLITQQYELVLSCCSTIREKTKGRTEYFMNGSLQRMRWIEHLAMKKSDHTSQSKQGMNFNPDNLDIFSREYDSVFFAALNLKAISESTLSNFRLLGLDSLLTLL
jgi:hypothetical protein